MLSSVRNLDTGVLSGATVNSSSVYLGNLSLLPKSLRNKSKALWLYATMTV